MTSSSFAELEFTELLYRESLQLRRKLSVSEFEELSLQYPSLRLEREANGKTTIMSPVKSGSGHRESLIHGFLFMWWYEQGRIGRIYSASTGIKLSSGSIKSPDCCWISDQRLQNSPQFEDDDWVTVVPNFVVEVSSVSDRINTLKDEMKRVWMRHGTELGWLISADTEEVWLYQADQQSPEYIRGFNNRKLEGGGVLKGFTFDLTELL